MDILRPEDRAELERTLQALIATTDLLKHWDERCVQSQRHDHSVTVWIVGLCAGGALTVGHAINLFLI